MKDWKTPTVETLDVEMTMGGNKFSQSSDRTWWTVRGGDGTEFDSQAEAMAAADADDIPGWDLDAHFNYRS